MASGSIVLDPSADPAEIQRDLLALAGIGPWTADYIRMRALADPDAFLPTDLGVRRALRRLNGADHVRDVARIAERWRPWRAYVVTHLWNTLAAAS